ncbi:MAG: TadE/TadG family type IV pilus assembly protein [Chloroflexota bacterium]
MLGFHDDGAQAWHSMVVYLAIGDNTDGNHMPQIPPAPTGSRQPKKRRGQATVELALAAMFLVLLLVGVADVARIYSEHLSVVHAAGVAARWNTLDPNSKDCSHYPDSRAVVEADLTGILPPANILSVATTSLGTDPSTIKVTVIYRHDFLFGIIQGVPNNFTGAATMPGTVASGPGTCSATPVPPPTATATSIVIPTSTLPPTSTNTPAPATPTNTQSVPTLTSTSTTIPPTPTSTVVAPTATNTLLVPSPTPTNTLTPTSTPTSTSTSTVTPTSTPTVCPYTLTVDGYKKAGQNSAIIRITVRDALNNPVNNASVTVVINAAQTLVGTTNGSGFVCFSSGSTTYSGNNVDYTVAVAGPPCPVPPRSFTTQKDTPLTCP